jgi:hypothetical protein
MIADDLFACIAAVIIVLGLYAVAFGSGRGL